MCCSVYCKVAAYDAATAEVNAFKNGMIHALIAQHPKQEGEVAVEAAAKLIAGGSAASPRYVLISPTPIDKRVLFRF